MRVRRIVDLSVPLSESTQVYPGDPVPRIEPAATIEADGFNLLSLRLGSQTGTHVDAPYHFRPDGPRVDELDLTLFAGEGVVVDLTGLAPRARISWEKVAPAAELLRPGRIALLHTGWPRTYGTAAYFDHPFLDADACRRMLGLGVRTFLLDFPSIDETPDAEHAGEGFPAHRLIAEAGGVIGENLRGFELIDFTPFVSCLPLRLAGADGAPVRAVAMDLTPEEPRA
ncbi:cyclase family protein [Actinomadura sp. DC4]|uniref:cyclase family protein n=1 Tax=Actinomadura sp. DC4 TaxID=3055069 RepID=UPI0025B1AB8D|nr:cyclase family protein [Actinomadura sp. DC4]MDN3355710.1 cyclase family protein [Actinomadura sp. DC4]